MAAQHEGSSAAPSKAKAAQAATAQDAFDELDDDIPFE